MYSYWSLSALQVQPTTSRKGGVIHSSVYGAKVVCQDQKDFNNEIKNVRHNLMLNKYLKEFVDSVMKPSIRNRPSSDTIYQGTAIIWYVMGISKKFRRISGPFSKPNIHSMGH
jgi:hypothetical protein